MLKKEPVNITNAYLKNPLFSISKREMERYDLKSVKIIDTDLYHHPAVKAWNMLKNRWDKPNQIEVLREKPKSAIYRLRGVGPNCAAIIAKECKYKSRFGVEKRIYETVLPKIPQTSLQSYGSLAGQYRESSWLFLEDAGMDLFLSNSEEHRKLAGLWFGMVHITAPRLNAIALLPDQGPRRYLNYLRQGRSRILKIIDNPNLNESDIVVLRNIVVNFNILESHWENIEQFCQTTPQTLVHGDLDVRNLRVRYTASGNEILVLDWEHAGYGVPAVDILKNIIDIPSYWSVISESWKKLKMNDIKLWADLGSLFRKLVFVAWDTRWSCWYCYEYTMQNMRSYDAGLKDLIERFL